MLVIARLIWLVITLTRFQLAREVLRLSGGCTDHDAADKALSSSSPLFFSFYFISFFSVFKSNYSRKVTLRLERHLHPPWKETLSRLFILQKWLQIRQSNTSFTSVINGFFFFFYPSAKNSNHLLRRCIQSAYVMSFLVFLLFWKWLHLSGNQFCFVSWKTSFSFLKGKKNSCLSNSRHF